METRVPPDFVDTVPAMKRGYERILAKLKEYGYVIEDYPVLKGQGNPRGMAAAKAYPIQGILKYHGMSDWDWRISYLPSISVNNDAAYSITNVEFDPRLDSDQAVIGGMRAGGRDLERVEQILNAVRAISGISSKARVVSKNQVRAAKTGKGLGTSASASTALAAAAVAAVFGAEAIKNERFLSAQSRLLAGSGCRSAVGGISLWLSFPGAAHEDSFAIRLDNQNQLDEVSLITVPIDSRIGLKTELAHKDAPNSSFYKSWMCSREDETIDCINAVQRGDWITIGQYAELDSIRLHGITMSGSLENKIFAWEPENIWLFRMCNELRSSGVPVYFSTDTGPTTVFITHKQYEGEVIEKIESLGMGFECVQGSIAGPAELVDIDQARAELEIA